MHGDPRKLGVRAEPTRDRSCPGISAHMECQKTWEHQCNHMAFWWAEISQYPEADYVLPGVLLGRTLKVIAEQNIL